MFKYNILLGFPDGTEVKNLLANAGDAIDTSSILGSGRSPGEGSDNPLQYPCGKAMDGGAWQATVHGLPKSQTRLRMSTYTCPTPPTHTQSYSQEVQKERKKNSKKLVKIL